MITVISHRGYWKDPSEKNTEAAFRRSFELGFGTETDLRDMPLNGKPSIVVSHDMPSGAELSLTDFFDIVVKTKLKHSGFQLPLALNIKSNGQASLLKEILSQYKTIDYFLFDMSVPDLIDCANKGLRCYTRLSEYEKEASLYDHQNVEGVWVDAFKGVWYDENFIRKLLDDNKKVALVSPDLHKRMTEFDGYLAWLVKTGLNKANNLMICTDFPEKAAVVLH